MTSVGTLLVALLHLTNLVALGSSRIATVIRAVAFQGVVLGSLVLLVEHELSTRVLLIALGSAGIKGWAIPAVLFRALRQVAIQREMEPWLGLLPSLVMGAVATVLAMAAGGRLPMAESRLAPWLVPTALATVSCGFLLLVTRRKAISQVLGFLILDNGVFVFGLLLVEAMPFVVEVGVLLDVLVGIFVASIILHHIQREFASLDTRRLSLLKE